MKNFREWISDYLRYFLLVLAGVLIFFLILIGYNLYRSTNEGVSGGDVVVVNDTEAITEPESEYVPETETESETVSESESESEDESNTSITSLNSAIDEDFSDKPYGETETETETEAEDIAEESAEDDSASVSTYSADTYDDDAYDDSYDDSYDDYYDDDSYIEVYEEEPEVYEPDYRTLVGACNLREGPGYDYDVITYYSAGTTVEYLGMENGWAKVEVDGMIGYMGPSFIG